MRVSPVVALFLLSTYALADSILYTDALASGYDDWSWSSTRNFAATASPARGSSISFLPTSNWAGLYLHASTSFQVTGFSTLQFYTNGGSTAPAAGLYTVFLYNASGPAGPVVPLPNPISVNTWTSQSIPISAFNVGTQQITGVSIQFSTGTFTTVYFDDISFVSSVATTTAAPTVALTSAPTSKPAATTTPTKAPTAASTAAPTTKPVTSAPSTTTPVTSAPSTTTPATSAPSTTKPVTSAPSTTKAVTSAPTTIQMTTKPATSPASTTATKAPTPTPTSAPTSTPTSTPTSAPTSTSAPSGPSDPTIAALFNTIQSGQGTYYGNSSGGACTLDTNLPSSGANGIKTKVAINNAQWFGSELCGACARVVGSGSGSGSNPIIGTFNVFIADQCPGCNSGDLDLAYSGDGRWGITWELVPCSPIGNLQYAWQGGVNAYYIKLQVRNHKYPVFKVAVQQGSNYADLVRSNDNFWLDSNSVVAKPLVFPMKLRITATNGQVVYDQVSNQADNNVIINGSAQFN